MQRNPKLFDDPLSFKPERFENHNTDTKSAYNWISFSAGPRNCIGKYLYRNIQNRKKNEGVARNVHYYPNWKLLCSIELFLRVAHIIFSTPLAFLFSSYRYSF